MSLTTTTVVVVNFTLSRITETNHLFALLVPRDLGMAHHVTFMKVSSSQNLISSWHLLGTWESYIHVRWMTMNQIELASSFLPAQNPNSQGSDPLALLGKGRGCIVHCIKSISSDHYVDLLFGFSLGPKLCFSSGNWCILINILLEYSWFFFSCD